MKLRSVYFDLDGVIVDSFVIHQQGWLEAFSSIGIEVNNDITDDLRGVPAISALKIICNRINVNLSDRKLIELKNLKDQVRDREIEKLSGINVFPWAKEILKVCSLKNVKIHCIATTRAANNILDKVGLGGIFHSVTCGIDFGIPKRYSAQTLANLIKKENLLFKETLFLDDSPEAINYAMNIGIPSFLIHSKLIKTPSKLWSLDYLFITASNRLLKLT